MALALARLIGALAITIIMMPLAADARELRIAIAGISRISGNPYAAATRPETYLSAAVFDGLTRFDKDGRLVPALATSWRQINATTWRFSLRRGVVFSNGEPFTADAVSAALAWLKSDPGAEMPVAAEVADVLTAEAEDENTVLVHTSGPDPILPQRLAAVMIVAPHAWSEMGADGFALHPVGTGPFALAGATADSIVLAANPSSWRKPGLDRIVLENEAPPALQAKDLLSGRIDVATAVGLDDIGMLQDRGMLVGTGPAFAVAAIALRRDETKPILRDSRVPRALNYAVDKAALKTFLHGLAPAAGQPAARQVAGYDPDVEAYPFDPGKARALLAEAGVGPGFALRVDAALDRAPGDRTILETLVAQMAAVGVELQLRPVDAGEAVPGWGADADGLLVDFDAAPLNDMAQPLMLFSCAAPARILCDPALAAPIAAAAGELDETRRLARLGDLAQALHDDPPVIYLNEQFDLFAVSPKVEGFALAERAPIYENIRLRP